MGLVIGAATLAASAYPTYQAVQQRREMDKARRANRTAAAIESRKAKIANARERRKAAIRARAAGQQALAMQAATGVQSTGYSGTLSSIANQAASNISFQRKISNMGQAQINYMNTASMAEGRANTAAARGQAYQSLGLPGLGDLASMGTSAVLRGMGSVGGGVPSLNQLPTNPQQSIFFSAPRMMPGSPMTA
jgi:hypothetical protein